VIGVEVAVVIFNLHSALLGIDIDLHLCIYIGLRGVPTSIYLMYIATKI
jgi:hypothetical protein